MSTLEQSPTPRLETLYMTKKFTWLIAIVSAMGALTLFAQEGTTKAAEGTLMLEKKTYPLKHALAYETTIDNEPAIAVVLSGQPVSSEKLKETKEAEKEGGDGDFNRPYLKLVFKKTGELKYWSAGAGGTMLGRRSGSATGEVKWQESSVIGKASQPNETDTMFPNGFDGRFDVALLKAGDSLPASPAKRPGPAANVKPSVTGVFKGNGKEAKLAYVSAHWREPFGDKPSMVLAFTEKDHSKDKKPDFNAGFGKFGSALVVSLHEDGDIFGCEVAHTALKHQNVSSIGHIKTDDFQFAGGQVKGGLATDGPIDVFGETWEVNLKFVAPLGESLKEFEVADAKKPEEAASDNPATTEATTELTEKANPKPATDQLKVTDL